MAPEIKKIEKTLDSQPNKLHVRINVNYVKTQVSNSGRKTTIINQDGSRHTEVEEEVLNDGQQ